MNAKLIKYKNLIIILFTTLVIFIGLSYTLHNEIRVSIERLKENIQKSEIQNVRIFAKNIENEILRTSSTNIYEAIKNDPKEKKRLENLLSVLVSEKYKYLFVLYVDKDENFRFLLDGTKVTDDKAYFDERIILENPKWQDTYKNRKENTIIQDNLGTLWITYLYPIVIDNQTKAIITIDFSQERLEEIYSILIPFNNIVKYFGIFLVFIFVIGGILVFVGYNSTRKQYLDSLTNVYNRNYLKEFLKYELYKDFSLMIIDIDNFKYFNDIHGYHVGDEVLIKISALLKEMFNGDDKVIRYGGEEFLIFIHKDNTENPLELTNNVLKEIANRDFEIYETIYNITVSIGLNPVPSSSPSLAEAIKLADEALHIAKKSGKNQCKSTQYLESKDITKYDINFVKDALEENRVINYYQPIVYKQTKKIFKYEALVRIKNSDGSIVLPGEFLGSIKNTHVYNDLSKIVLKNIMIHSEKNKEIEYSLNMEMQDFFNNNFMQIIFDYLKLHQHIAKRLTFEILETTEINDFDFINEQISQLQKLGAKVSIDDFGCGYSNFIYLLKLNVNYVKIDGSIIQELEDDSSNHAYILIKYIVNLAHAMNIEVIAEFVSSEELYNILETLGVEYYQGYYLGYPEPLD